MCLSAELDLWCEQEAEAFAKAASLDTHKALVHIFFAQRATKKVQPRLWGSLRGGAAEQVRWIQV